MAPAKKSEPPFRLAPGGECTFVREPRCVACTRLRTRVHALTYVYEVYTRARLDEIWPDVYSRTWCRSAQPDPPAARTCVHLCTRVDACTRVRASSFSPIARAPRPGTGGILLPGRFLSGRDRPFRLRESRHRTTRLRFLSLLFEEVAVLFLEPAEKWYPPPVPPQVSRDDGERKLRTALPTPMQQGDTRIWYLVGWCFQSDC